MKEQRLKELFHRYISQSCTQQEETELMQLLTDPALEETKNVLIEEAYDQLPERYTMTDAQGDMIFQQILERQASVVNMQPSKKLFTIRRIAVAASIILILGVGSYFLFFNKTRKQNDIVKTNDTVSHDVAAPKGTKAMITLIDGHTVPLDRVANGTLAIQGNVNVTKTADGKIIYSSESGVGSQEIKYNTLTNPRGSKVIDITLNDGSQVSLNAGSSVTYPVSFVGNERKVSVTGEAYFEVAHNAAKPFKVKDETKDIEVEVLGTHFNINTYDDEPDAKVTLLEGSVKVSKGTTTGILKPGQQAQISNQINVVNGVDIDKVMAWKNGLFSFDKADIGSIMRQIARWYDVEVEYTTEVKEKFHVEMSRNTNVSNVFKILEETGGVHFKIEGRKVTIIK